MDQGLPNVSQVYGCEISLYYPDKYAGKADVIGVHNDDHVSFTDNIEEGIFTAWPVPSKTQENFESKAEELDLQREWPEDELEEMYEIIEDMEISLTGNAELSRNLEENLGVRDLGD